MNPGVEQRRSKERKGSSGMIAVRFILYGAISPSKSPPCKDTVHKMGKFVIWEVKRRKLLWSVDAQKVKAEEVWDGCYVVRSDVPKEELAAAETVAGYKKLELVEQAFRQIKTVQLEVRPVYHKLDRRIRSHVFLCMLAYYLQWHMKQRLAPLFAQDGTEQNRRWSFANVLERLKAIRQERAKLNGIEFNQVTVPEEDQQKILQLLKVKL